MASFQEIASNVVLSLKAEGISAAITLMVAMLMWFAVLPIYNKMVHKKLADEEEHCFLAQTASTCWKHAHFIARSGVTKCISSTFAVAILARSLKMIGALEHPIVILPLAFVFGGLVRSWMNNSQSQDAVEYPENETDEDMTLHDACHHSEAFWSDLGQPEKNTEMQSLLPSDILSDVLLSFLSDAAISPVLKSGRSTWSASRELLPAPAGQNALSTASLLIVGVIFSASLACLRSCGACNQPMVVLPLAFLLGGLARFVLSRSSSGVCEDYVDYEDSLLEEDSFDNDVCHHSAAFWAELEPADAKVVKSVLQPSDLLSDVLLGYLNDPVVSSIFIAQ